MDYSYENLGYIVNNLDGISSEQVEIICEKIKFGWYGLDAFRRKMVYDEFKFNRRSPEALEKEFKEYEYSLLH